VFPFPGTFTVIDKHILSSITGLKYMTQKPYLHIPRPTARPGEKPDFSYLKLSDAGAVDRPPIEEPAKNIEYLSHDLVRVLDDDHEAKGPWDPSLDKGILLKALRYMVLTRAYDDRMQRVQRQGKISFYIGSLGEEAISIGQGLALEPGDMLFPSYRNQGLFILRGTELVDLMCQCLSNTGDMCKGRQMPIMYQDPARNIFSISGNLATQFPQAVGWAMGSAIKGYQAPVILNVVNNQWAISTFQGFAGGERRSFAARGLGLGIPGIRVDGNDLLAVYAVTRWAAERARSRHGPTLIEHVTYRGGAHSTSDDPSRYRPKDEWAAFPLGDPMDRLVQHLVKLGHWSDEEQAALETETKSVVDNALKEANSFGTMTEPPFLDAHLMFEDVFREMPDHLRKQRDEMLELTGETS